MEHPGISWLTGRSADRSQTPPTSIESTTTTPYRVSALDNVLTGSYPSSFLDAMDCALRVSIPVLTHLVLTGQLLQASPLLTIGDFGEKSTNSLLI